MLACSDWVWVARHHARRKLAKAGDAYAAPGDRFPTEGPLASMRPTITKRGTRNKAQKCGLDSLILRLSRNPSVHRQPKLTAVDATNQSILSEIV